MTVAVETGVWQLDQTASTVGISHKTMWGLVNVKGTFGTLSGQGEVRGDGSAIGTVTLDAASWTPRTRSATSICGPPTCSTPTSSRRSPSRRAARNSATATPCTSSAS